MAEQKKSSFLSSTVKVATGLTIGALGGFIAGIVLAPKSGKETIEDIKSTSLKLKSDATERVNGLKERGEDFIRNNAPTLKLKPNDTVTISTDTKENNPKEGLLERIQGITADSLDD